MKGTAQSKASAPPRRSTSVGPAPDAGDTAFGSNAEQQERLAASQGGGVAGLQALRDHHHALNRLAEQVDRGVAFLDEALTSQRGSANKIRMSAAMKGSIMAWVGKVNSIRGVLGADAGMRVAAGLFTANRELLGTALEAGDADWKVQAVFSGASMLPSTNDPLDLAVFLASITVGAETSAMKADAEGVEVEIEALARKKTDLEVKRHQIRREIENIGALIRAALNKPQRA